MAKHRELGLFLGLLLLLGPGLLVNAVFKNHFGRPRPNETTLFGGNQPFQAVGAWRANGHGKSFPSGHASMGFYWLGLFVYLWNSRRKMAWSFGLLGLTHGMIMGLVRIGQGRHWPSDVLWSAGFVYLAAWLVVYAFSRKGRMIAVRTMQSSDEIAAGTFYPPKHMSK
jgi:lipid A 4'-phosphatase